MGGTRRPRQADDPESKDAGYGQHRLYQRLGAPAGEQITTAREQANLGRAIQDRFPDYYRYFATASFRFRGREIGNHNALLTQIRASMASRPATPMPPATIWCRRCVATASIWSRSYWAAARMARATPACASCSSSISSKLLCSARRRRSSRWRCRRTTKISCRSARRSPPHRFLFREFEPPIAPVLASARTEPASKHTVNKRHTHRTRAAAR